MVQEIKKRDGRIVKFDLEKIARAINKAIIAVGGDNYEGSLKLADQVKLLLEERFENSSDIPNVEQVQDIVEEVLIKNGHDQVAKQYILYRHSRTIVREKNTELMKTFKDLTFKDASDNDLKRENANINTDTAMGTMLKYGSESSKAFSKLYVLKTRHSQAHENGDIHIHDLDFYMLTETCCHIGIGKLLKGGFHTGHGYLREPNSIQTAAQLTAIAIQSNQNDQHGGQSIPDFEYGLALYVAKSYVKELVKVCEILFGSYHSLDKFRDDLLEYYDKNNTLLDETADAYVSKRLSSEYGINRSCDSLLSTAKNYLREDVFQAMEALIHNLNTLNSRAGSQVPFSSINYGTGTTPEQRLIIESLLLATDNGLGNHETPIFPVQIFKVKDGISGNPGDPNYDLFKLACKVSAKRLFPNFAFIDAPFNLHYYKEGNVDTEVAYMGCRTRIIGNNYDPSKEIVTGRGNLSFTSINLPRLAILSNDETEVFFKKLKDMMELVFDQLLERFKIQCQKKVKNYPSLMGQGIWIDSDKLEPEDSVEEVLKHGSLTTGFIGLAECLKVLTGCHHGESEESQGLGLEIITYMRELCDNKSKETGLNFTLIGTPAEGLSSRFTRLDKERFGIIPGVTDREYYTNSFHVPVYYKISAMDKIKIEAPYHALTNGGHISYVEVDGDPLKNLEAFEDIIQFMKKSGIGYGSINHPVDYCPICGYTGIIGDRCPRCGNDEVHDIPVSRLKELKKKFPNILIPECCDS